MFAALLRKLTVPVKWRLDAILVALIGIGWIVGFAAGMEFKPVHLTKVIHTKVTLAAAIKQFGKPDTGGDGAQIGFPGTTCYVWYKQKLLICKP